MVKRKKLKHVNLAKVYQYRHGRIVQLVAHAHHIYKKYASSYQECQEESITFKMFYEEKHLQPQTFPYIQQTELNRFKR